MIKRSAILGLCVATTLGAAALAQGNVSSDQSHSPLVLAQLTPRQAECQAEAAQLQAQLAQCTNDDCRRSVQAAIAAHNQRCQ